jgi:hypothetical protein
MLQERRRDKQKFIQKGTITIGYNNMIMYRRVAKKEKKIRQWSKMRNIVIAVPNELFYFIDSMLSVDPYMTYNNVTMQSVSPPLVQELESLGISIKRIVGNLNDEKELENLADKLKDEFLKEKKEMEEKGLFVNPGGG